MEVKRISSIQHSPVHPAKRTAVPFITMINWPWIIPHSLEIPQPAMVEQFTTTNLWYLQNPYSESTLLKNVQTFTMQEIFNSAKTHLTSMMWYWLSLMGNMAFLQQLQVHLTLNSTWTFNWYCLDLLTIKMPQSQFQMVYLNTLQTSCQKVFMTLNWMKSFMTTTATSIMVKK